MTRKKIALTEKELSKIRDVDAYEHMAMSVPTIRRLDMPAMTV